jgi:hypothetical protein
MGVRSACKNWYGQQRHRVLSCVIRPVLWTLAITVALFPALHVSHASVFDFDVAEMAEATNTAGFFRDFFFITIVIAILAISNMVDSMFRTRGKIGDFSIICFILLGAYFIVLLLFGTSQFIDIATVHGALNPKDFNHDYNIIRYTMLAGLGTEIIIALREPLASSPVVTP